MTIAKCRSCGSADLCVILDLGRHPVSNAILSAEALSQEEKKYPLAVALCCQCALLQVTETVSPEELYQRDYPYFSSASPALLRHVAEAAEELTERFRLGPDSLVVEVASNDGYFLQNFVKRGIPCLGIDPAASQAQKARDNGIPTINDFFSCELAETLAAEGKLADLMLANNVVAHVDAINDFVAGFARMLKRTGTAVFECAYAVNLIQSCEFDTIYHEHLFYHTLSGVTPLFERHGLYLNDAEWLPIHGGSLRFFVGRDASKSERHEKKLDQERRLGVDRPEWYEAFSDRVVALMASLIELLLTVKAKG
jgi:SAM-dependent methyltransferase